MSTITGEYVDSLVDHATCIHPRVTIEVRDSGADVAATCTRCGDGWVEPIDLVIYEPTDDERADDEADPTFVRASGVWKGEVVHLFNDSVARGVPRGILGRTLAWDAVEFGARDAAVLRAFERDIERGL